MPRFLFGPADDEREFDRFLKNPVDAGRWATFGAACPSWEAAVAGFDTSPEAVLLWLGYASVPAWVWSAPVPVVALAHDPNLLWNGYQHTLPLADLVLTDALSAERFQRAGLAHVRPANLFGLDRHFLAGIDTPEAERDIDVLFVGNLHPAVQGPRSRWLGRLGLLAGRYQVRIAAGVFDEKYSALLRRAKLVFNPAVRGECNLRAFEAAASGAVLLQEADNAEVRDFLEPESEYASYTDTDFENVVERLLAGEETRRAMAARARERVRGYAFDILIEKALDVGGAGWDVVKERAAQRVAAPPALSLAGRLWQRTALAGPNADPSLVRDLEAAGDRHALALLVDTPAAAEPHLAAAAGEGNRLSAAGHAWSLASLGQTTEAVAGLRRVLADLDAHPTLSEAERETIPYPVRFDYLRVGWERAGYDHPDDPAAENAAKLTLLKGRVAAVLAELTGELAAYTLAAQCCPEIPAARAAAGFGGWPVPVDSPRVSNTCGSPSRMIRSMHPQPERSKPPSQPTGTSPAQRPSGMPGRFWRRLRRDSFSMLSPNLLPRHSRRPSPLRSQRAPLAEHGSWICRVKRSRCGSATPTCRVPSQASHPYTIRPRCWPWSVTCGLGESWRSAPHWGT